MSTSVKQIVYSASDNYITEIELPSNIFSYESNYNRVALNQEIAYGQINDCLMNVGSLSENTTYIIKTSISVDMNGVSSLDVPKTTIDLYLRQTNDDGRTSLQFLETIDIDSIDKTSITIGVSPHSSGAISEILFKTRRVMEDYRDGENEGRKIVGYEDESSLYSVDNKIEESTVTHIGVEGTPGLPISINGNLIYLGQAGFYEFMGEIDITSLGFYIDKGNPQGHYFILNYVKKED